MDNAFDNYKDEVKYDFIVRGKFPYKLKGGNEDQQNDAFDDFVKQIENLLSNEDYLAECFKDSGIARGRIYCKLENEDPEMTILFGISSKDAEKELNKEDILDDVKTYLEDLDSDIESYSASGLEVTDDPDGSYEPAYVDFKRDDTKKIEVEMIEEPKKNECAPIDINKELESIDKKLVNESKLTFKNFVKQEETKLTMTDDGVVELYENNKLTKSQPFSKLSIIRECKELLQNGYILIESLSEEQAINIATSQAKAQGVNQYLCKYLDGDYHIGTDTGSDKDCCVIGQAIINPETKEVEWVATKLEESQVKVDKDTVIDTDEAKAEIEQATKDVDELQKMKDELNDKVDHLMEEGKDRNLKDEFNQLSKEEQEKYLEMIPENNNDRVEPKIIEELAKQYNLDYNILYWVINIRSKLEDKDVTNDKFPSTQYTQKILTANELKLIELNKVLTDEQLDWLQTNIGNTYEIEDGLRNFVDMIGSVDDETVISLDNYFESLKDELNK